MLINNQYVDADWVSDLDFDPYFEINGRLSDKGYIHELLTMTFKEDASVAIKLHVYLENECVYLLESIGVILETSNSASPIYKFGRKRLVLSNVLENQNIEQCCRAFVYDYRCRGLNPFLHLSPVLVSATSILSEADVNMSWEIAVMDSLSEPFLPEVNDAQAF